MDRKEDSILKTIEQLVEEEQELYKNQHPNKEEQKRLKSLEVQLDQCWDLLRQRRALREYGKDPDEAKVRPAEVVEDYEQ